MNRHYKKAVDTIQAMNPHYKKVVFTIQAKYAHGAPIGYLFDETFVNKYFSDSEFNEEILTDKVQIEFDRRLKVALNDAVMALNNRRNVSLILFPFIYFFGGILRDLWIEDARWIEGEFFYYLVWFFWVILCFLGPLLAALKYHLDSKSIKNYIGIDLESYIPSERQVTDKVMTDENHSYSSRLKELDKLLEEGLISQSEYDKKRKLIIKDL